MLLFSSFNSRACNVAKCINERLTYALGCNSTYIHKIAHRSDDESLHELQSSLNSIIVDHIQCGELRCALSIYHSMHGSAPQLRAHAFVALLKACALLIDIEIGCHIHAHIARIGLLETNLFVGNALIDMYVKWGCLARAVEVHHALSIHDVVTWTALIGGHAEHGYDDGANNYFMRMQLECVPPNAITLICMLKACATLGNADKGKHLHAIILVNGLLQQDLVVRNALLAMYAKCGMLAMVQKVFDGFAVRNIVSWNSLISGYTQHECSKEALFCFEQMLMESIFPNAVTFLCILTACGCVGAIRRGTQLYAVIVSLGLLEKDRALGNALVDIHAKCGSLARAQEVFNLLPVQDVVAWTALIAGYAQHEHSEDSLYFFERMQSVGVLPNAITYTCSLKACGGIRAPNKGKEIHCEVARRGILRGNVFVGNALVDMYIKCGLLATAQEVFDKLQVRDVISWNTLIAGYVQHEQNIEALLCYREMHLEGMLPNALTVISSLNGCGSLGAADTGKVIHDEIMRKGLLKGQPMVGTALVDMYAKCGMLPKAETAFDELPVWDSISWNSLITGYAQLGDVKNVLLTISRMKAEGSKPDLITFLNVLNACSHAGLVDEGELYFDAINNEYGLTPAVEHYVCILDLLSRAGQLETAMKVMGKIPFHPNSVMTLIVLSACRKWGNVELAMQAFEEALEVDEKEAAVYSCMLNICADIDASLKHFDEITASGALSDGAISFALYSS